MYLINEETLSVDEEAYRVVIISVARVTPLQGRPRRDSGPTDDEVRCFDRGMDK